MLAQLNLVLWSALGIVLLSSAWSKVRAPRAFRAALAAYPLPRWAAGPAVARGVPVAEGVLGLGLLALSRAWSAAALAGTLAFLTVTTGLVAVRLARGEVRFRCGCAGDLSAEHSAAGVLARNATLIVLAAAGLAGALGAWQPPAARLPLYLAAGGLVLGLTLAGAARRAWGATREWTASG
jgi:hypothetical protein